MYDFYSLELLFYLCDTYLLGSLFRPSGQDSIHRRRSAFYTTTKQMFMSSAELTLSEIKMDSHEFDTRKVELAWFAIKLNSCGFEIKVHAR